MATPSNPSSSASSSAAGQETSAAAWTLQSGLRLSRGEFERRYRARPDLKKAELIEGVVHVPSAVRYASHARPHAAMVWWLGAYAVATPGVHVVDNATLRLDGDNELQPDAALLVDPRAGGQARISADDYVEGAPELVAEIAATSASYDLRDKRVVYQRNGVREYLVWHVPGWPPRLVRVGGRHGPSPHGARRRRCPQQGLPRPLVGRRSLAARRSRRCPAHLAAGACGARSRCVHGRPARPAIVTHSDAQSRAEQDHQAAGQGRAVVSH